MSVIEYTRRPRQFQPKETLKAATKKTIRLLIITLAIMITTLSATYLITSSNNNQKGYELELAKLKNNKLRNDSEKITNQITSAAAFTQIEQNPKLETMDQAESKAFLTREDNLVKP